MKYMIVKTRDEKELEYYVNKYLSEGWQVQGGVSVAMIKNSTYTYCLMQAMTKK